MNSSGRKFFSWRDAFMASKSLTSTQKLILHTLATYMNAVGDSCYPTVETLAEKSSLKRETIIRQLKPLKKAGWIKVDLHGFSRQKWRRHEYSIGWPEGDRAVVKRGDPESPPLQAEGGDSESPRSDAKVVTLSHKGGDPECVKVVTDDHLNTPVNTPKNSPEGTRAPERTTAQARDAKKTTSGSVSKPDWCPDQVWSDFLKLRRAKKAPLTPTAWQGIKTHLDRGAAKGYDRVDMLRDAVVAGWTGFRLDWYENRIGVGEKSSGGGGSDPASQMWDGLVEAIRRGPDGRKEWIEQHPEARSAVQSLGGFSALTSCTERDLRFLRKDFVAALAGSAA